MNSTRLSGKLALWLLILCAAGASAQEATTMGKEFYVSFFMNAGGNGSQSNHYLYFYITSLHNASGTISNPATSYSRNFTVSANRVTVITLPAGECVTGPDGNVSNAVLKVVANDTISLFAFNTKLYSSEGSVILPVSALGINYRVISHEIGFALSGPGYNSTAMVVATEDNTIVQITPKAGLKGGRLANMSFTVAMNAGQSYCIESASTADLSGTLIKSINACKKIAVFCGMGNGAVPAGSSANNHYFEQVFPVEAWGRSFVYAPALDRSYHRVRVLAHTACSVKINSTNIYLAAGAYHTINCHTDTLLKIVSTQPVAVMGYTTGQSEGGNGDPAMFWVNPTEQVLKKAVFCVKEMSGITKNYVNIMVKTQHKSRLYLNNIRIGTFKLVPADPAWSVARLEIDTGSNYISCDSGFTAFAYGFGQYDAYAYTVGSSTFGTNPNVSVAGVPVALKDTGRVCLGNASEFKVSINYPNLGIKWFFGDGDSSASMSNTHTYLTAGDYNLRLLIYRGGDCVFADTFKAVIRVQPPLKASITGDTIACYGSTVTLRASGQGGMPSAYVFKWSDHIQDALRAVTIYTDTVFRVVLTDGCSLYPDSAFIRIKPGLPLEVAVRSDTTICKGQAVQLFAKGSGGSAGSYKYSWDHGLDTGRVKYASPAATTTYRIILSDGCSKPDDTAYVTIFVRDALLLNARQDTFFCMGQGAQLYASASGGDSSNYSFLWDHGIGNINSSYQQPSVTTTYRVIVSDNCSADPDTACVTLNVRTALALNVPPDTTICRGQSRLLSLQGTGGDSLYYTFNWDNGVGTGNHKTVWPDTTTTYTVKLTDNCTSQPDSASITITVRPALEALARTDTSICIGQSVSLYGSAAGGLGAGYQIKWSDGNSDITSAPVSPEISTTYLMILSDNCTVKPDTAEVFIHVRAPLDANLSNDTTICRGQSVIVYSDPSGGDSSAYSLTWDQGLGSSLNHQVSPVVTTDYQVILGDNCSAIPDTATVRITVREPLKVYTTADTLICSGQKMYITATATGGDPSAYSFNWDHSLGNAGSVSVAPDTTTTYRVIVSDNCTSPGDTAYVTVSTRAPLSLQPRQDTTICSDESIKLYATPMGGNPGTYSLNWDQGLGTGLFHLVNPFSTTKYRVILSDNCSSKDDTAWIMVYVRPELKVAARPDTVICIGQSVALFATAAGGDTSGYIYNWDNGLAAVPYHIVAPATTTNYRIILGNNCRAESDTDYALITVRDPLALTLMPDTTICSGQQLMLNATGSGGYVPRHKFSWDQGIGDTNNIIITPLITTIFRVILSDGQCSFDSDTQFVTVNVRAPLHISMPADTVICSGRSVNISATASGGDSSSYEFKWDRNMGNGMDKTFSPDTTTIYTLVLNDQCTKDPDTATIKIKVRDPLRLDLPADTLICFGQKFTIRATGTGGFEPDHKFSWDNNLGEGDVKIISPEKDTKYEVVLSDKCSTVPDTGYINISVRPELKVSARDHKKICFNDTALLFAHGSGGDTANYKYSWDQGAGEGQFIEMRPAGSVVYAVLLSDGCSTPVTDSFKVEVEQLPEPAFNADPLACFPDPLYFTSFSRIVQGSEFYWDFGDGSGSNDENPVHYFSAPGTYSISLKIISPMGCRDSVLMINAVKINPKPVADFNAVPDSSSILASMLQFINLSTGAKDYAWHFGDNSPVSEDFHNRHEYLDTGTFKVLLIATNAFGCSDTAIRPVRITDVYRFYIPSAFSPNGDGINDEFISKGQGILNFETRIFNLWGAQIFESKDRNYFWNGGISNQHPVVDDGVYMYMIRTIDFEGRSHYYNGYIHLLR